MPSRDEIIPVAFALHNSPRRYALLIGSGISRDTGILTAEEITDDLIKQIAGGDIRPEQNPRDWYRETFGGKALTFSSLFDEIAKSDEDRKAILGQYFEPVGRDKKNIKIDPTPAHWSIARLVRDGIICMIITTNFDSLLEDAIKKETGRTPLIITHVSDERLMEVAGEHCRIIMVNGRYPTTDLKLTPDDLANYDEHFEEYIDRIFSEYGLLICGWSGKHDVGLVRILTAERTRRYAIFWCSLDVPEKIPDEIRRRLHLSTIGIRSANEFFRDLELQLGLLRRYHKTTSLTVGSAIKKVKDVLREPRPELFLSDLFQEETNIVLTEINRINIIPEGPIDGKTCFKNRIEELERASTPLAAMLATLAYYDNGTYGEILTETIDRLINLKHIESSILSNGQSVQGILGSELNGYLNNLRLYPALLATYASGITAVHKGNFNSLSAILEKPRIKRFSSSEMDWKYLPYFDVVNIWHIVWTKEHWTLDFSLERYGKRENVHYYPMKIIQEIINYLIPNEIYFDLSFDVFEYFYGLTYLNLMKIEPSKNYPLSSRLVTKYLGPYFGEFSDIEVKIPDPIRNYFSENVSKIESSKFFSGNLKQFERCNRKYSEFFNIKPLETGIDLPPSGVF